MRRTAAGSGVRHAGSGASKGDGSQEGSQEGRLTRRPDPAKEPHGPGHGDRPLAETEDGEEAPNNFPQEQLPGIRDPARCPGEALLWQ